MRWVSKYIAMFILTNGLLFSYGIPARSVEYRAWISVEWEDSVLMRVKCFCEAPEDGYVRYELKAAKSGGTGTSKTSQSGRVYVKKNEAKALSLLKLGISSDDSYIIRLKLYKEENMVAEDSVFRRADGRGIAGNHRL